MTARVWLRCLVVSLVASVLAPVVTMTAMAPGEGQEVADLRALDPEKAAGLAEAELSKYLNSIPMRRVTGFERITYWFTHPQWYLGIWPAIATWFTLFFLATGAVSWLNARAKRGT